MLAVGEDDHRAASTRVSWCRPRRPLHSRRGTKASLRRRGRWPSASAEAAKFACGKERRSMRQNAIQHALPGSKRRAFGRSVISHQIGPLPLASSSQPHSALACAQTSQDARPLRCYRTYFGTAGWKTFYETCDLLQQCVQQIPIDRAELLRPMDVQRIMYGCADCSDIKVYQSRDQKIPNVACQYMPMERVYKCCCKTDLCNTPIGISGEVIPMIEKYQKYGTQAVPCTVEDDSKNVGMPMRSFAVHNHLDWKRFEELDNGAASVCGRGMHCCKIRFKHRDTQKIVGSLQKCMPDNVMKFLSETQAQDVICATQQLIDNVKAGRHDTVPDEANLVAGIYNPQHTYRRIEDAIGDLKRLEIRARAFVVGITIFFGFVVVALAVLFRTFSHENEDCRIIGNVSRYLIRFNSYPPEIQAVMRMRSAERLAKMLQQQPKQPHQEEELLALPPTAAPTTTTTISILT